MHYLTSCILISLVASNVAYVSLLNPKLSQMHDGFLELKSNGSLILRSSPTIHTSNSSPVWQDAIVFKTILNALRLMPLQTKLTLNNLNHKAYDEGVEHKFPPFLERVIQRIQTYFSIYKYTDTTSQPVLEHETKTTTTTTATAAAAAATTPLSTLSGIINKTLTLNQNEIDNNLSSNNSGFNKNNKTLLNMDKFQKPLQHMTSTTTLKSPTVLYSFDENVENNEFNEVKNGKGV